MDLTTGQLAASLPRVISFKKRCIRKHVFLRNGFLEQNYTLAAKDPKQRDSKRFSGSLQSRATDFGSRNPLTRLGVYSLGVYSLGQLILDLEIHSPDWQPTLWASTVWECTAWESTVSGHRFRTSRATHLRNRKIMEGPSTQPLFRETPFGHHLMDAFFCCLQTAEGAF